ncbi:phage/plasmid primase, P4 family [Deinococcus hopiensis]|nr:phage/plasmid primase, P4 family [Deinococcus hopiensis]
MPWPAFEGHPDEFRLTAVPEGKNAYWGVALRTLDAPEAINPKTGKPGMGDKAHTHPTHLQWAEVDLEKHPELTNGQTDLHSLPAEELAEYKAVLLRQVLAECERRNLPPRAVVDSGHGLHLYWARRARSTMEETEAYNRRLVLAFGASTESTDQARILRLPGTFNLKNPQRPLPVQVLWQDAEAWVERDALDALPELEKPKPVPPSQSSGKVSQPAGNAQEKYAQSALQREVDAVRSAGEGGRNHQLNRSAFSVGTLVGAGALDEVQAAHELTEAALAAGLEESEIRDTVRSGLAAGKQSPRDLSTVGQRHWENKPQAFGTIGGKGDGQAKTRTKDLPDKPTLADYRDLTLDWCAEQGHVYRYHQTRRSWWQYKGGVYVEVLDEVMYQRADKILQSYGYNNLKTANIREVLDKISREESVAALEVDQTAWELNTRTGILDLESGLLHDHTPEYFSTIQSAAAYRPGSVAHDWMAFLRQAVPDEGDRLLLQQFAGLCLTGDTSPQRALVLVGDGGTGKSTFVRVLQAVLGNLATSSALENIKDGSFLVGNLVGKRMCVVSELQQSVDWLPFKRITGEDTISVDVKNKTPFTTKLDIKLIILTNVMPRLGEDTSNSSLMRRFLPVAFNVKPEKPDPTLEARLTHPDELPGVLNWMLEGLRVLRENNMRFPASDAAALAREIVEDSNKVIGFLRDECRYVPDVQTASADLYAAYRKWCGQNGFSPLHINNFGKHLISAAKYFGKTVERDRNVRGTDYRHIQLSTQPGMWEDSE